MNFDQKYLNDIFRQYVECIKNNEMDKALSLFSELHDDEYLYDIAVFGEDNNLDEYFEPDDLHDYFLISDLIEKKYGFECARLFYMFGAERDDEECIERLKNIDNK